MRPSFTRCLARLLAVAVLGFASADMGRAAAATADEPSYSDWFKVTPETTQMWSVSGVGDDPYQVRVVRSDATAAAGPVRKVAVFYPRPSSAYDTAISKILGVFAEKGINAEFTVYNFRTDDAEGVKALKVAKKNGAELIFAMGSESTAWLYANFLDGPIPVISVCSKDPVLLGQTKDYDVGSGTNFAFTSLNMPVEVQMAYVLDFKPNLKNFAILVDSQNVSAVETQAKPIAAVAKQRGIQVLYLDVKNPENAKTELAELVSSAVTTMRKSDPSLDDSLFWITGSTSVFKEIATINSSSDRVPVLSVVPENVKAGNDSAVMSIGISFESNAHLAAIYGADVLAGTRKAGELPVGIVSPPDIAINFRKVREIGLNIPFNFVESASKLYDYDGNEVGTTKGTGSGS
jgi:putative tryptophan/tyrosine transport system substrate-binding protein